ncbi:MAG: bifunctional diguanylate cyclase/phosphodiesterase [Candidatus Protistobacter heckmanni]|nr:bifunctional diguanylate cyclase/phosphodiesterase [Candidatus Protistobacter heckmanni]
MQAAPQDQNPQSLASAGVSGNAPAPASLLARLLEQTDFRILTVDTGLRVKRGSEALLRQLGLSEGAELSHGAFGLLAGMAEAAEAAMRGGASESGEIEDAAGLRFQRTCVPLLGEGGETEGVIVGFREISDSWRLANYDPLTGLPNWKRYLQNLEREIERATAAEHQVAVFFLNIDDFNKVNDSAGRAGGDRLLAEVGERLRFVLYSSESVSRLGADDFAFFMRVESPEEVDMIASEVLACLRDPFELGDQTLRITGSVGISLLDRDGRLANDLHSAAEAACHYIQGRSRNEYVHYTPTIHDDARQRVQVENGLYQAVENGELRLYFQPIISVDNGTPLAAEALLRWKLADGSYVPPKLMIRVAEETELIQAIGAWVMEEAARQAQRWARAGYPIPVSVNVSPVQFRKGVVVDQVKAALELTGLPNHLLELEITESLMMEDTLEVKHALAALRKMGLSLAIDDFGTGFSNLSYLRRYQSNKLKIDQSFVQDLALDKESERIVAAIIGMARSLNLLVVAEGVETEEQLAVLKNQGCDAVQGYFYSRPLPAEDFMKYLTAASVPGGLRQPAPPASRHN